MDKKTFLLIFTVIVTVYGMTFVVKHYQPESVTEVNFDSFPLKKGNWVGTKSVIPEYVIQLLQPKDILMARFKNDMGDEISLLFDFFNSSGSIGGPHSPRNCLPGSGWIIDSVTDRTIIVNSREITIGRFNLRLKDRSSIMDFWYITKFGETANDYKFKLYSIMTSLTFQERNVGFIRIIASDTEQGKKAMADFEEVFVCEIYDLMPF